MLAALLAVSSAQNVFAATLDQQQENFGGGFSIFTWNPVGQEFQPSLPSLQAVEVYIRTIGGGGIVTLTIMQASIGFPPLVTATQSLSNGFVGWVMFTFASISVTPGTTYVIRLQVTQDFFHWGSAGINNYPRGRLIIQGNFIAGDDAAFRTYGSTSVGGVVLPTNSLTVLAPYLAMIGLVAVAGTVYVTKRRR